MVQLLEKGIKYITDPDYRFLHDAAQGKYNYMTDKQYLQKVFRIKMGYELDLSNPKTFNEKIQWLKIYDHNPIYMKMVDKVEAKSFVRNIIGDKYIIKTLGVWDSFDDIDFDALPNQFVLKCSHDSGGLVICKDKKMFDYKQAKKKINRSLRYNYYWGGREWPYKELKPRILAEEYMEDGDTKELRDYKFFTFGGVPKLLFVATDRGSNCETKFDFFDMEYNHLPFTNGHPNADPLPEKPKCFDEMIKLAEILAKNTIQLRVDFYEVNGKVYFGELTLYHWSGLVPFEPPKWDEILGNWITIPQIET